jgi:Fe-S cluster assembly protein SufD
MSELTAQLAAALPKNPGAGPEWLTSIRQSAAEQFRIHGLPTRKDEAWKYTGLGLLGQSELQLEPGSEPMGSGPKFKPPLVKSDFQVNMLNGRVHEQSGKLPAGLSVLSLSDALENGSPDIQALLESLPSQQSGSSANGFSALNSATLDPGLVVHVAAGTDAGRLSIIWESRQAQVSHLINSRFCVILEKGATLDLLEQFESANTNTGNIVLQADVGEEARFHHIRFQQESELAGLVTLTEVSQSANSEYSYFGFDLGGGLVRHDLHTALLGRGAKSFLNGAYLLDGNRHVDNHAKVDHRAPGGFSDQYFRGVAGGSGRAVFNTAVCVHKGADETEALQSNANILLSARAEVDTKPELEIYADEVVASHGATVGQLDEMAVFYLRSRGLSEQEARQLLTAAFCRSVSDKLADRKLADVISARMMEVMPQAE